MSQVKVTGNASGTGTLTIAAPNTNSNYQLDLPTAAGTIQVSGNPISGTTGSFSGDLSFNSGYGSAAVAYGCRAWVNFNGTGTVAIRGSGNVTSITDNGVGDYTVNFTNALSDANYSVVVSVGTIAAATGGYFGQIAAGTSGSTMTTSAVKVSCRTATTYTDPDVFCVSIFR